MFDSEFSTDDYKSPKNSIRTVMKNPEILKFISDHLKPEKMCKNPVKKLPFVTTIAYKKYWKNCTS